MKTAVTSIAFGYDYAKVAAISFPSFIDYAKRIGADFVPIRNRVFRDDIHPHWEKLRVGSLLDEYDRVIYLDADILVALDAPSPFETITYGAFGGMNEAPYGDRLHDLEEGAKLHGLDVDLRGGRIYLNMGVMVFDRKHRELFRLPAAFLGGGMPEQTFMNLRLLKWIQEDPQGCWCDIGLLMNRFHCISPTDQYLEGKIIHYAGWSHTDRAGMIDRMKGDIAKLAVENRASLSWLCSQPVV